MNKQQDESNSNRMNISPTKQNNAMQCMEEQHIPITKNWTAPMSSSKGRLQEAPLLFLKLLLLTGRGTFISAQPHKAEGATELLSLPCDTTSSIHNRNAFLK